MPSHVAQRIPFSLVDEMFLDLEVPGGPVNIQLEAQVDGPLDAERVHAALRVAAAKHPMFRVAMAPHKPWDIARHWQLENALERVPLQVMRCGSAAELAEVRSTLHGCPITLEEAPPFRCVIAHMPGGGDWIMLSVHHAACDGMGVYRFLVSVLRGYAGVDDPSHDVDFLRARDLMALVGSRGVRDRLPRLRELMQLLSTAVASPARIAQDLDGAGKYVGQERKQPNDLGFVSARLHAGQLARLQRLRRPDTTLNDLLAAALHLGIESWNRAHGVHTGRINMMMPVNMRPSTRRYDMAGNASLWAHIASGPAERQSFPQLLESITMQTGRIKRDNTAGLIVDLLHEIRYVPLEIKRRLPALLPLTGHRAVATTVFSNLGRLPNLLPADAGLAVKTLQFSPPCQMPLGVALGAAGVDDQLHLVFRYHREQFRQNAAQAFARTVLDCMGVGESQA